MLRLQWPDLRLQQLRSLRLHVISVLLTEYIRLADQFVAVPGGTNNNNYANVDLIIDIAQRTKVQVRRVPVCHSVAEFYICSRQQPLDGLCCLLRSVLSAVCGDAVRCLRLRSLTQRRPIYSLRCSSFKLVFVIYFLLILAHDRKSLANLLI